MNLFEHSVEKAADYFPKMDRWTWGSESFYRDLYDDARLEAQKIHDREKVAAHWLRQLKWFTRQVTLNAQTEDHLDDLVAIVAACKAEYELHA
jgi:polyisoprenoid-binding protein YceI